METSVMSDTADKNRIARDYAYARIEVMEETDLHGCTLAEVGEIAADFHRAQIELIASIAPADRRSELKISSQFDHKVRLLKLRLRQAGEVSEQKPAIAFQASGVRLPKINIPPFDGKVENWVSFIQLYDSLIHQKDIPEVEKLHYLLSSVQGDARDLIKNYPLSDDNYMLAYNCLKQKYDRKIVIATLFYERMLNCEPVKSKSSLELQRVGRVFRENLEVLEKYQLPDKNFMLYYLLWSKLDMATKEAFQLQLDINVDIPCFQKLRCFVEKRGQALENATFRLNFGSDRPASKSKQSFIVPPVNKCSVCSDVGHNLEQCSQFLEMSPYERFDRVKEMRLCINCLHEAHTVKNCRSSLQCADCKQRHHTLLHFSNGDDAGHSQPRPSSVTLAVSGCDTQVLFSTAMVLVKNKYNKLVPVRILLDSASACNFMTQACAKKLGLPIKGNRLSVNGIGQISADTLGSVVCDLIPSSGDLSYKFSLEAFVLPQICSEMPSGKINIHLWKHIKDLDLADPDFYEPAPVDMLVNVNFLASILQPGLVRGEPGQPIAVHTVFGWIVMGECSVNVNSYRSSEKGDRVPTKSCLFVSNLSLDNDIKRFWELENVQRPASIVRSKAELTCDNYMKASYSRVPDGKMMVPLTFADPQNKPQFSHSREIALKRLANLERKFKINPQFQKAYVDFMKDYQECGHMKEVEPPSSSSGPFYYIPHHGVMRPDSVTTPLRTVFDASAKDAAGRSLNDLLLPGPKLQKNIFDLLLRFRWHAVVFTGDIKQMYRQFLVQQEDCDYQRILWRFSQNEPVRDFQLLTVTYGVSCAPYQALWCVSQLANEFSLGAPNGAAVLARDTYVDDVVSGAQDAPEARKLRQQLLDILSSAGLHLRKWTSNSPEFLEGLPESDLYSEKLCNFDEIQDIQLKILGLSWLPKEDSFTFKTSTQNVRCTKRSILSDIARIFDPLGLLSPVVFFAKYLMQLLWLSGVGWDSEVSDAVAQEWHRFKSQLSVLSSLSIPRRMIVAFESLQLHGFCDASEKGYCAVIYFRVVANDGSVVVRLCCAKSKVAPLRRRSIPRLELLAAVLLSELIVSFREALRDIHSFDEVYAWSDSTVALTWIRACPSKWKTFVANRVADIQESVSPQSWHHIAGSENPADPGSRGLLPEELTQNVLWWAGPPWLSNCQESWPQSDRAFDHAASEELKVYSLLTIPNKDFVDEILNRFSSLKRILRVMAYCFRFVQNLRRTSTKPSTVELSGEEVSNALRFLVKHVQEHAFASELRCLSQAKSSCSLPKSLKKLSPFLDEGGHLRVGGRLCKGDLSYDVKHPFLLPRDHRLTALIIEDYHQRFMHPGLQTLQNLIAQEFWILSSRRAIQAVISACIKCFRAHPRVASPPLMGDLPSYRISQLKAFSSSAVDYAGPFDTCLARGRGLRTCKSYICVFVCTATKAVHLELVSELTSEAYIAALRRFISRRGRCSRLISDQGTNFVGASNILRDLMMQASRAEQIDFAFNPPGSPHFSGLAEAGVKSVKTHLARVIGLQRLTFEELYTVLTQIEAMLNSRPLSPVSSDPNDFSVLTPGHFLTLEPLTILPETNMGQERISVLQRWKLLQKIHQDFWRKWHLEYLHTLQARGKWYNCQPTIATGTLVLIINEQSSPMKWKVGRVVQIHPGTDGVCRVVTVRTSSGELKRPVVKLCPLPIVH